MVNLLRHGMMLVATMVLAMVVAGCGGGSSAAPRTSFVEFSPDQMEQMQQTETIAYKIQEGDVLRIAFPFEKNLNQETVVLTDGAVSLAGVDRIVLAGLTITEADSVITNAYSADYVAPSLSIIVLETKGRQVYVLGEVRDPGLHRLPMGGLGMVGAVTVAGGFTNDAATVGTVLVRVTSEGYMVKEVDLSNFGSVESLALATVDLLPYDIVYVPRSRMGDFAYFSRTVLSGLVNLTRIAVDLRYLSGGNLARF